MCLYVCDTYMYVQCNILYIHKSIYTWIFSLNIYTYTYIRICFCFLFLLGIFSGSLFLSNDFFLFLKAPQEKYYCKLAVQFL